MNNFDKAIYDHIKALKTPQYKKWRKYYEKFIKREDAGVMYYKWDSPDDDTALTDLQPSDSDTKSRKAKAQP